MQVKLKNTVENIKKTHIEIDLGAIKQNLIGIKEKVGPGRSVLLAVKADGYGHGAVSVSKMAEENALVDAFGVSSPQEGVELREAGISLPILILGLILPCTDAINTVLDYDLTQTVADVNLARAVSDLAKVKNKTAKLHLKIDTGMGRIGCKPDNALEIGRTISRLDNIELEGIFSHFPVSDDPDSDFTRRQIKDFRFLVELFEKNGIYFKYKHMANSAAILNYDESVFNMVRPGLMAYGYKPSGKCRTSVNLIPSMSFKSCIVFFKRVEKGTALSYGLTYKTKSDTNIATVPAGYGDGYSRALSNKGRVIIRDKEYPVVGRVCMDQILIDLGDDEYPLGEEVILFGRDRITADTIAGLIDTIPYEVTCAISKRVQRTFLPAD